MLNLARRLRATTFDGLIGQPLIVRILKNSLYKNYFFPLYLFSGMRGCGKTSTARIFALAVNCFKLNNFQKQPLDNSVPCLECKSCLAGINNNHPDIIEIDAASNTGVDNVRQIIDNSTFMPILGKKKVYIIDEAHMLSKAAFNAFLKVLEEPPESVIFILATTEHAKIIDTVKSRSMQIYFKPVIASDLKNYLVEVCNHEKISIDNDALSVIVSNSEGSVRDALNMLEQIRFVSSKINSSTIKAIYGGISVEDINKINSCIQDLDLDNLKKIFKSDLWSKTSKEMFFKQLIEYYRNRSLENSSSEHSLEILLYLVENEAIFIKSNSKQVVIEVLLLNFIDKQKKKPELVLPVSSLEKKKLNKSDWGKAIGSMVNVDPLVITFFQQAEPEFKDNNTILSLPVNLKFFADLVWQQQDSWQKYVNIFGKLDFEFTAPEMISSKSANKIDTQNNFNKNKYQANKEIKINLNNKVSLETEFSKKLLELFPGEIYRL